MQTTLITNPKAFSFDYERGALVPLESPGLPVGQIVTYEDRANPRKEFVVVSETISSRSVSHAQPLVCLDDGHRSEISMSGGKPCGHWTITPRILTPDELDSAIAKADAARVRIAAEEKTKSEQRATDRAAQRAQWAAKYPHLQQPGEKLSSHACGAKNIRKELAAAFPGIKFSVRSDSYTGGDSIDVTWELGPTTREVEAITGKYQEGSFNGMEDIYETNYDNQWPDIYGGAKYVSENRHEGNEAANLVALKLCEFLNLTPPADGKTFWNIHCDFGGGSDVGCMARSLILSQAYPPGAVVVDVERTGDGCGKWESFYHVVFTLPDGTRATLGTPAALESHLRAEYCETSPESRAEFQAIAAKAGLPVLAVFEKYKAWDKLQCDAKNYHEREISRFASGFDFQESAGNAALVGVGVNSPAMMEARAAFKTGAVLHAAGANAAAVSYNAEKHGIEIQFPAKPDAGTLASLKKQGWRWSKFSACWYHRASTFAANWAADLVEFSAEHRARLLAEIGGSPGPVSKPQNSSAKNVPVSRVEKTEAASGGNQPLSLEAYWDQSVSQSVLNDYAAGRLVVRHLDAQAEAQPVPVSRVEKTKPVSRLVEELKDAGQDHEFYPTTEAILAALVRALKGCSHSSVLDIGAGNGKVLRALRDNAGFTELHAIEKSSLLCKELDAEILVVGTNFEEQSLLSKNVDVVFCNPPYSDFVAWAEKIIRQAASEKVFLVLPQRWETSEAIKDALKYRGATAQKLGAFDFEDAEDRTARAKVHLLCIRLHKERGEEDDAFERFFQEQFADLINKFAKAEKSTSETDDDETKGGGRARPFHKLVVGPGYPEALVNLYNQEMANIERNYKLVGELDVELLREFEIFPKKIMACLKARTSGLRNDYWMELFSRLRAVTDRLTAKSRKSLLGTLHKHVQVDFTVSNIYEIVCWIIKNANRYIDSQLLETYEVMVEKCNVQLYKSNQRVWVENRWRSRDEADPNSRYALDYRIVTHRLGGCRVQWRGEELTETSAEFLGDLLTLARNLGFNTQTNDARLDYSGRSQWRGGEKEEFHFKNKAGEWELLFDVRAFKNGNVHLRLNKDFMLALNVEHGRLRGWLRTPKEAAEELQDPQAAHWFNGNLQLGAGTVGLLLTAGADLKAA